MNTEMTRRDETRPETVQQKSWIKPPCDVHENEAEWLIAADVPGAVASDLRLHLDKGELTIEAPRDDWFGEATDCAGYKRTFSLPAGIDGDKVKAELNAGVVAIHLPKSEAIKPRLIQVKAG